MDYYTLIESVCSVHDTLHLTVCSQHGMALSKDSVTFWSGHAGLLDYVATPDLLLYMDLTMGSVVIKFILPLSFVPHPLPHMSRAFSKYTANFGASILAPIIHR